MTIVVIHRHRLFFVFLVSLIVSSCHNLDRQIDNVKQTLQDEDVESRKAYQTAFQQAIGAATDTVLRGQIGRLDRRLTAGLHYMDSIYGEVNFEDEHQPPDNSAYVTALFLQKGVGDSLYSILVQVNALARQTAQRTGRLAVVDTLQSTVLNEPSVDKWKNETFSMVSPLMALILLHAFRMEMYETGRACLPAH